MTAVPTVVTTTAQLQELCARIEQAGQFGLDTEFIPEDTYHPRLALVQVACGDDTWIVDPVALPDLEPLARLVAAPSVTTVVHAGDADLGIFHHRFGAVPANLFDTQLAAAFCGHELQSSYQKLAAAVLGVQVAKGTTMTNWLARPLSQAQLRYAHEDVRHLLPLAHHLRDHLHQTGRWTWFREDMARRECAAYYAPQAPDDAWKKVKKSGGLSAAARRRLKALAAWRESEAARRDVPRRAVLADHLLVEIARRNPSSPHELRRLRLVRVSDDSADAICAALRAARASSAAQRPAAAAAPVPRALLEFLSLCLSVHCGRLGLPSALAATKKDLEAWAQSPGDPAHRLNAGWRSEVVTPILDRCRTGAYTVAFDPRAQQVCLVERSPAS